MHYILIGVLIAIGFAIAPYVIGFALVIAGYVLVVAAFAIPTLGGAAVGAGLFWTVHHSATSAAIGGVCGLILGLTTIKKMFSQ